MSWILAFLGFAVLIILHEFGHFAVAKAVGMRVERFSLFFPPLIARHKGKGETEYAIGMIPLGGYVKISGMSPHEELPIDQAHRAYFRQPVWKRIAVISAGPAVNIFLAFAILTGIYAVNGIVRADVSQVGEVQRGLPAEGELRPGDRIVSVDGFRGSTTDVSKHISAHKCPGKPIAGCEAKNPAVIVVQRENVGRFTLKLRPVYDAELKRTRLGFTFEPLREDANLVQASGRALEVMWEFTAGTVSVIAQIFNPEKRDQISGVVGSYETTRQAVDFNLTMGLFVLAAISLSLGVINLFPFLPLDGGHIFWALAEKIRGRAIPFAVMERAGFVGFALVIMLFFIGLSNDIGRLTGEGFDISR